MPADPKPRRRFRATTREQRLAAYGWPLSTRCLACGAPYPQRAHVVPRGQGGDDHASNVMPLCRDCHADVDQGYGPRRGVVAAAVRRWLEHDRPDALAYVLERKGAAWLNRRYPAR